jgi:CRP-like cAMP-binding protein
MNTFLTKISQLESICEVTLLSHQGELLFRRQSGMSSVADREVSLWNAVLDELGRPTAAELLFSKGRYYLHATGIGFLIVGMTGEKSLKKIRTACANVQEKLVDPTVCKRVLSKMLSERAIEEAAQVRPAIADASVKDRPTAKEDPGPADNIENLSEGGSPEEAQIKELLGQGEKRQAIALIMQFITKSAKEKRFEDAEQLRDWLMQVDSMALVESIRAAEIIEEEKKASISNEFLLIWKELLNTLSPEEFSSLYHATTQKNYADGEVIAKQGEFLSTLFFINSGRIQLNAVSQGREMPLKVLGPGEILGGETFFDFSVWTVNALSQGASLSLLTWQRLQSQKDNCPALRGKLHDFCLRFTSPSNFFVKSNRTRRQYERKKVSGRVTIDLLDQHGVVTGLAAKGELLDLSKGGVALSLRFSKKKNAAALLGQKIKVNIRPDGSSAPLLRIGKVMAVRCHDFIGNDYSLHIEFDVALASAEMQQIVGKGH